MHLFVGLYHVGPQPGTFQMVALIGLATVVDDLVESLIDRHLIPAFVHELTHGMADMYLAGKDDEALKGTPP